jgi:hypothetical protein
MKKKTSAKRSTARLMMVIWLASAASLAGCSSDGLNQDPSGWLLPGKFPVDREVIAIRASSNNDEQNSKQNKNDMTTVRPKLQKKRAKSARASIEGSTAIGKDKNSQAHRSTTARTAVQPAQPPPPAEPVPPKSAESRSTPPKPQSLQLRLRSRWPEAPPPGTFSR